MTRDEILEELDQVEGDLAAFRRSMDSITDRKAELESYPNRQKMFLEWPATQALINVLIMAIMRCEGLLEDYHKLLDGLDIPDNIVRLERRP
jgi:tetrahydromethanopterin S-methyltransferase subunit B